jgi:CelD/BcsL family acetyltransferase involved in cellulose biosynthesis
MTHLSDAALPRANTARTGSVARISYAVSVTEDLAALQTVWDRMIADGAGSSYQSFAFQKAWADQSAVIDGTKTIVVVMKDGSGQIGALLPLSISRKALLSIASMPGGKHVNFNMPIALPGFLPTEKAALKALFKEIGRAAGVDVFSLVNQPNQWNGRSHPFLPLGGQPSPSFAYKLALSGDCESVINAHMSSDARHKLRRKVNRLKDMGDLRFARAETAADAEAVLDAFLAQKRSRMAAMGLSDPFSEPGIEAFLRQACLDGLSAGKPGISLFGLWIGPRVIATYGAVVDANRFSGMFTAFDNSEDVFRWSPGEQILLWLIQQHCRLGLTCFDLGIGEARYKSQFCDQDEPLFDLHFAATGKGKLATGFMQAKAGLKRRLKQNQRFMAFFLNMRRKLARAKN